MIHTIFGATFTLANSPLLRWNVLFNWTSFGARSVYHSKDTEKVTIDFSDPKAGWTYIDTYKLSEGTAKIELTDESEGRIVFADAVKWVKKD